MMSQALSRFHLPWLSCIGLLLFLAVFIGAVLWVTRRGSGEAYRKLGEMPLEDSGESIHG